MLTGKSRILVLEDDPSICRALARTLSAIVWSVPVGSVGAAERALDDGGRWAGLIVDIGLPDGSGLAWLEHRRATGCVAPALVATSHEEEGDAKQARDVGAQFFRKPVPSLALKDFALRAVLHDLGTNSAVTQAIAIVCEGRDLTHAEVDVVSADLRGLSREDFVELRRISANTYKGRVKGILDKLGADRMADVRARILRQLAAHH